MSGLPVETMVELSDFHITSEQVSGFPLSEIPFLRRRTAQSQGQGAGKKQDLIRDPGGGEDLVLYNQIKYSSAAFCFLTNIAKLLRI